MSEAATWEQFDYQPVPHVADQAAWSNVTRKQSEFWSDSYEHDLQTVEAAGAAETLPRRPGDWRNSAACLLVNPELFFPVGTSYEARRQIEIARAVCGLCPVRAECFRYALDSDQQIGIWGSVNFENKREVSHHMRNRRHR